MAMNSQLPSFRMRLSQISHFRPYLYAIFADTRQKIHGIQQSGNVLMGQQSRGAGATTAIESTPTLNEKLLNPQYLHSGTKSNTTPVGSDLIKQWDCFSTDLATSLHYMMSSLNTQHSNSSGVDHRRLHRHVDSSPTLTDNCMKRLEIQEVSSFVFNGTGLAVDSVSNSVAMAVKHAVSEQKDTTNHNISVSTSNNEKGASSKDDKNKPTHEQLESVKNYYLEHLPQCHSKPLLEDLRAHLHHKNIVFENHFFEKPRISVGMRSYAAELLKLRLLLLVKYVSFYFTPKTATVYPAEGCVRIHWMLNAQTFSGLISSLSKFEFESDNRLKYKTEFEAISTLFLDKDGKIVKHHIDRRNPVGWKQPSTAEKLAAKLLQPNKSLAATERANFKRPC